jgi:hypothetical protein
MGWAALIPRLHFGSLLTRCGPVYCEISTARSLRNGKGSQRGGTIGCGPRRIGRKGVLEHAPKVEVRICSASSVTVTDPQLDHYIIYHCHFELGKLYAARGDFAKAGKNFDIVMSGKLRNDHAETNADEQVKSQRANRTRKHRANTRLRELYYSKHTQRSRNSERRKRASSLRPRRGFVHAYT